jgi:hypothetical protein
MHGKFKATTECGFVNHRHTWNTKRGDRCECSAAVL